MKMLIIPLNWFNEMGTQGCLLIILVNYPNI
jgi:hypothetical protein